MALDITALTAEVAIVPSGQAPTEGDWIEGTWVRTAPAQPLPTINRLTSEYWFIKVTGNTIDGTDSAYLQVFIGPAGTIALPDAATKVDVFSRIHGSPEVPVQKHATVTVTAA
jgi:hypothetical protein